MEPKYSIPYVCSPYAHPTFIVWKILSTFHRDVIDRVGRPMEHVVWFPCLCPPYAHPMITLCPANGKLKRRQRFLVVMRAGMDGVLWARIKHPRGRHATMSLHRVPTTSSNTRSIDKTTFEDIQEMARSGIHGGK